jgi:hypothetical protein
MLDQLMEGFRKASESTLQIQQDMLKHWTQQWMGASPLAAGASSEWGRGFLQRWQEMAVEMLNKHRESLDATYRAGIQVIEQTFRLSEAKSSDDLRRTAEELWRKMFDTIKSQYETQFEEFHRWTERSFEMAQRPQS